jgi:uncharacterized protein YndB with AHSA1/START domain
MVTVRVEESIVVAKPVEEVFAYTTDITKTPEWAPGVVSMARQEVAYRGRSLVVYFQVTAYEPGQLLAFSGGPENASQRATSATKRLKKARGLRWGTSAGPPAQRCCSYRLSNVPCALKCGRPCAG